MRIYLAGPMTGYPGYNFAAFDAKKRELEALGHIVVSPADLDRAIGFDPANPRSVEQIPIDDAFMDSAIMRDVLAILPCDALALLDGWEKSRGARGEKGIAEWRGRQVFLPDDVIPPALQAA